MFLYVILTFGFAVFTEVAYRFSFQKIETLKNLTSTVYAYLVKIKVFANRNAINTIGSGHILDFRHHP
jgi:hypothetical protein